LFIQLQEDLTGHQVARSFGVSDFLLHNHTTSTRNLFSDKSLGWSLSGFHDWHQFQQINIVTWT